MKRLTVLLAAMVALSWGSYAFAALEFGIEGPSQPENYTMWGFAPGAVPGTTLPNSVPEYHWWNGCSPTAAGMLFAYWDTYLGKDNLYTFHDGDSSYWDKTNMDASDKDDYGRNGVDPARGTHSMVASWEHYQAGQDKGLTHGSWDRNGNDIVDPSDVADWNCLADFMRTENGGTYRSDMAQGFEDFAMWDDPDTPELESYHASATTDWSATWDEYIAEIDAGRPVHVGIPNHSILGFGYWTGTIQDSQGNFYTADWVINWTTWGGGWDGYWGLVDFGEVYAFTTLEVQDIVPEPGSMIIWSVLALGLGVVWCRRRKAA